MDIYIYISVSIKGHSSAWCLLAASPGLASMTKSRAAEVAAAAAMPVPKQWDVENLSSTTCNICGKTAKTSAHDGVAFLKKCLYYYLLFYYLLF